MHYLMLLLVVSVSQMYAMKPFLQMIDTKRYCQLPVIIVEGDQFESSPGLNVIGSKEQRLLSPGNLGDIERLGDMKYFPEREVKVKNAVFEKYFDRSYGFQKEGARIILESVPFTVTDLFSYMKDVKVANVVTIREPELKRIYSSTRFDAKNEALGYGYEYYSTRLTMTDSEKTILYEGLTGLYTIVEKYGDTALAEAEKDLRHCYREVLLKAYKYFTPEHKSKTLSLPVLSALLGFPEGMAENIAIEELLNFVRSSECKSRYDTVFLFVSNLMVFKNHVNKLCKEQEVDLKIELHKEQEVDLKEECCERVQKINALRQEQYKLYYAIQKIFDQWVEKRKDDPNWVGQLGEG